MTPEELYRYASRFARRAEKRGLGTQYPTFRQVARRFRVPYDAIEEVAGEYMEGRYMGVAVGVCIPGYGYGVHEKRGDYLVEAYE